MKDPNKKPFLYGAVSGFCAISLSILFFFVLFKLPQLSNIADKLVKILAPFIYGIVIAYLLRPICNWLLATLKRHVPKLPDKAANAAAVALSMLAGILIVYGLIAILVPQVYYSIISIWDTLPAKTHDILQYWNSKFSEGDLLIQLIDMYSGTLYGTVDNWVTGTLVPNLTSIVSGVGMSVWKVFVFLKDILIGLIVAVYLLYNRQVFKKQSCLLIKSLLNTKWADALLQEVRFIDSLFGGFVSGKILDSAIIGVLCYVACLIFKFPNALLVSFIIGITNIIPFFGPFIGAVPSTLLIILEEPAKGLWFILFILLLQQVDGNIIGPKILGNRTGLSSFWVMFSIVLFGGIWGIVGMIIAVPLMAVIYDLVRRFVYSRLAQKEADTEKELKTNAEKPDKD